MVTNCQSLRKTNEFRRGRNGEQIVATWLQKRGYCVIPCYDYAGENHEKAPKMQGQSRGYVLPDLLACRNGCCKWVEVKTKAGPTHNKFKGNLAEHGMGQYLCNQYHTVQKESGIPVFVFVVEECSKQILYAPLDKLQPHGRLYNGNKMNRGGMVFWPRDCFQIAKET